MLVRSWFEPDSVMEYGFKHRRHTRKSSLLVALTILRLALQWFNQFTFLLSVEKGTSSSRDIDL